LKSFFTLIDRLNATPPENRQAIKDEVWSVFGVEKAILCLDMSQFSLSVRRTGIVSYLGLIRRMHVVTEPMVLRARGAVVKYQADNLMAVFDDARDAVEAAVGINRALADTVPDAANACQVAIGVDFGRFLMVPGRDCFGDPVNVAYKLGEDLARPGEILVTAAVRDRLGDSHGYRLAEQRISISGLEILAYGVQY
jgi:class 3 adenylate cyclase